MIFEKAVIKALDNLPPKYYQRVDGLMCEAPVLYSNDRLFRAFRLWLLEKIGIIESYKFGSFWLSCQNMKSYRLTQKD